jgi:hypothetical protein
MIRSRIAGVTSENMLPFPMTQKEFADAIGMRPVHLGRVLGELRDQGLIEPGSGTLSIIDTERLKAIAGYQPNYLHLDRTEQRDPEVSDRAADLVDAEPVGFLHEAAEALKSPFRKARATTFDVTRIGSVERQSSAHSGHSAAAAGAAAPELTLRWLRPARARPQCLHRDTARCFRSWCGRVISAPLGDCRSACRSWRLSSGVASGCRSP